MQFKMGQPWGDIIPIDGKTLRRSYDRAEGRGAIHMVSAWSSANGVVLGQLKTEETVRTHWSIENQLHWSLDVSFNEDQCRVRKDNAPENFAIIRHIALSMLKKEKTSKVGIKIKRNKAGWDNRYLAQILMSSDF
jgi:predicted transposase YbfD/YdcC